MRRIAVRDEHSLLVAALYITRAGELPPRDWAATQLGELTDTPAELLAGRPSTPAPDRGAMVCVCHGIGENQIVEAAAQGATSVEAVGKATCAGTNCGSCRPAIARLIDAMRAPVLETAE